MRVLHILVTLRLSGAETMLRCAAPAFRARGVDGEIVATGPEVGPFAPALEAAGYVIHHVPFRKSPGFIFQLYRLMRARRCEVVHVHAEQASFWVCLVALACGARVVRTVHNAFPFAGLLRARRALQRRILTWLGVRFVAIGASVADNELRRFGIVPTLVPNWYDSERFAPVSAQERMLARASLGIAQDAFVLASVGNCNAVKNHAAVLAALAGMPPEERPLYLHVGQEEAGLPERSSAQALGVAEQVRFLGMLTDVRQVLAAADAYVMPSKHEGFPIAALEALACALPAVIADAPGLRDLRDLGPAVICVPPDAAGVREGIGRARAGVGAAGASAAAEVHRRFGVDQGVDRYCALYAGAGR